MQLPNAKAAFINDLKLRDYCLNSNHHRGKHKARLFNAILGLSVDDVDILKALILEGIQTNEAILGNLDEYGQRYIVDFSTNHNRNTAEFRTVWIIRITETFPRLVRCYILR